MMKSTTVRVAIHLRREREVIATPHNPRAPHHAPVVGEIGAASSGREAAFERLGGLLWSASAASSQPIRRFAVRRDPP